MTAATMPCERPAPAVLPGRVAPAPERGWSERWDRLGDLLAAAAHGQDAGGSLREVLFREHDPVLRLLAARALLVLGSRDSGSLVAAFHDLRRSAPVAVHRGAFDAILLAASLTLADDRLTVAAAQAVWPALPAESRLLVVRLVPRVEFAGTALGMLRCAELDAARSGAIPQQVRRWIGEALASCHGLLPGRRWEVPPRRGLASMPVTALPAVSAADLRALVQELAAGRARPRAAQGIRP